MCILVVRVLPPTLKVPVVGTFQKSKIVPIAVVAMGIGIQSLAQKGLQYQLRS